MSVVRVREKRYTTMGGQHAPRSPLPIPISRALGGGGRLVDEDTPGGGMGEHGGGGGRERDVGGGGGVETRHAISLNPRPRRAHPPPRTTTTHTRLLLSCGKKRNTGVW